MSADIEDLTDEEREGIAQAKEARQSVTLDQRLIDAEETSLYAATFDPDEAEELGAFIEKALTEEDAESAMLDNGSL